MPATLASISSQGPGSAGSAWRGKATASARATQADTAHLIEARDKLATLVVAGETWAISLFTRLEAELAKQTAREDALTRARQIAEMAARKAA